MVAKTTQGTNMAISPTLISVAMLMDTMRRLNHMASRKRMAGNRTCSTVRAKSTQGASMITTASLLITHSSTLVLSTLTTRSTLTIIIVLSNMLALFVALMTCLCITIFLTSHVLMACLCTTEASRAKERRGRRILSNARLRRCNARRTSRLVSVKKSA